MGGTVGGRRAGESHLVGDSLFVGSLPCSLLYLVAGLPMAPPFTGGSAGGHRRRIRRHIDAGRRSTLGFRWSHLLAPSPRLSYCDLAMTVARRIEVAGGARALELLAPSNLRPPLPEPRL